MLQADRGLLKKRHLGTMTNKTGTLCLIQPHAKSENHSRHDLLTEAIACLGVDLFSKERLLATLPFVASDATGGSEIEMQVAVKGHRDQVDLPLTIEASNYFANLLKRARSGDNSEQLISGLEDFLNQSTSHIWENSSVRFSLDSLHPYSREIFQTDLLADKRDPAGGPAELFKYQPGQGRRSCQHRQPSTRAA